MKVTCGETKVTAKTSVRYRGVDLDQSLDGELIAEAILKKGNLSLKFLWRQAKFLNQNSRRLLASSLIQCHFDYACSAWYGGLQKIHQQKLKFLQNKTIRFVLDHPSRSHVGIAEFKVLNYIPVAERAKQIKFYKVYSVIHAWSAPKYLEIQFSMDIMVKAQSHISSRTSSAQKMKHFGQCVVICWACDRVR